MSRSFRDVARNQAGATALEFALVAPVFLLLLMGTLHAGQMAYGAAALNGAVQAVARNSTLEGAKAAALDAEVEKAISAILPGVKVSSKRDSYFDFADIGRAEKFTDGDGDGVCNNGEPFADLNGNKKWDTDSTRTKIDGASDVVVTTYTAVYSSNFAVPLVSDAGSTITLTAKSIKKNQPFAKQDGYSDATGTCK